MSNFISTKQVHDTVKNYSDTEKQIYATFRENDLSIRQSIIATTSTYNHMFTLVQESRK